MLIAEMHKRVASVRKSKSSRRYLYKVKWISVPIGKHEMGPKHKRAIRALFNPYVFTEALAQKVPECVEIKIHRAT